MTVRDLKFSELREKTQARDVEPLDGLEWALLDWAQAMAAEAGEICSNLRHGCRLDDVLETRGRIAAQLGYIVAYADILAARLEIDLADVVVDKFNAVSVRVGSKVRLEQEEVTGA